MEAVCPSFIRVKAPRGYGVVTNPKRAAYNWVYRRTTVGLEDLAPKQGAKEEGGAGCQSRNGKGFGRGCLAGE